MEIKKGFEISFILSSMDWMQSLIVKALGKIISLYIFRDI